MAENRVEELDKARLANVPVDVQKEISTLKTKLVSINYKFLVCFKNNFSQACVYI